MRVHLRTPRLLLRQFTGDDVDSLVALDSDPEVMRYLSGGSPTPRETVRDEVLPRMLDWHARSDSFGWWAAVGVSSGEFLGWFEFRPEHDPATVELGYRLRTAAWGHGYATEGARALIDNGFRVLGVRRVVASTMAVNTGSRRVLEKCGLRHVRTVHLDWPDPLPGSEHGDTEYALDRVEWAATG
ncbi:GNAT family N-acetyltransferase [Allosaccharopolyspora coralli]|uniref:GNAT family N-acetyltransferase n=1 Tax=Allosaccharopolyspora coralli TaxID=2665642 RepID=A0A5Q3QLB7_9PSEU|nr:GNAT family N-acetyltransferase [Allosaccharopolyspora coralli]QGK72325.1 GNAT family N-acetyltransferase [Allosaccharopolyspora coralli]